MLLFITSMTSLNKHACLFVAAVDSVVGDRIGVVLTDSILELSVTIGYLGADVHPDKIHQLDLLIREHCVSGLVAMERGNLEAHLHFQMVVRARTTSAHMFGILV